MKKLFIFVLLLCLFAVPALADTSRVVDNAGLLDYAEEQKLQYEIDHIVQTYGIDVVILTVNDIGYRSPGMYAADYYDAHGYGVGEERSGLIFLISMADRDYFTAVTGKAEKIFDLGVRNEIHDSMVSYLSRGKYFQALDLYLDGVESALVDYTPMGRLKSAAPIILLAGLGIGTLVAFALKSQLKTVRRKPNASSYVVNGSFRLTRAQDIYLYTTTRRRKIETYSSSGGSGGSFRSSSGRSFSGSGGKF